LKGVGLGAILLVSLLVAFPWAITSMVAGMGKTGTVSSPGTINSTSSAPLAGSATAAVGQLGETDIALFIVLAVFLIEVPYYLRSKGGLLWELVTIGGSILAALLAILLAYGLNAMSLPSVEIDISGALLVVITVVGLAVGASVFAWQLLSRNLKRASPLMTPAAPHRRKPGSAARTAMPVDYGEITATGYRRVVISCYASFCALLGKLGVANPPSRTPRELASDASKKTSLDRELMNRLTSLFEKARYSHEDVVEEDANESTSILGRVGEEVGSS